MGFLFKIKDLLHRASHIFWDDIIGKIGRFLFGDGLVEKIMDMTSALRFLITGIGLFTFILSIILTGGFGTPAWLLSTIIGLTVVNAGILITSWFAKHNFIRQFEKVEIETTAEIRQLQNMLAESIIPIPLSRAERIVMGSRKLSDLNGTIGTTLNTLSNAASATLIPIAPPIAFSFMIVGRICNTLSPLLSFPILKKRIFAKLDKVVEIQSLYLKTTRQCSPELFNKANDLVTEIFKKFGFQETLLNATMAENIAQDVFLLRSLQFQLFKAIVTHPLLKESPETVSREALFHSLSQFIEPFLKMEKNSEKFKVDKEALMKIDHIDHAYSKKTGLFNNNQISITEALTIFTYNSHTLISKTVEPVRFAAITRLKGPIINALGLDPKHHLTQLFDHHLEHILLLHLKRLGVNDLNASQREKLIEHLSPLIDQYTKPQIKASWQLYKGWIPLRKKQPTGYKTLCNHKVRTIGLPKGATDIAQKEAEFLVHQPIEVFARSLDQSLEESHSVTLFSAPSLRVSTLLEAAFATLKLNPNDTITQQLYTALLHHLRAICKEHPEVLCTSNQSILVTTLNKAIERYLIPEQVYSTRFPFLKKFPSGFTVIDMEALSTYSDIPTEERSKPSFLSEAFKECVQEILHQFKEQMLTLALPAAKEVQSPEPANISAPSLHVTTPPVSSFFDHPEAKRLQEFLIDVQLPAYAKHLLKTQILQGAKTLLSTEHKPVAVDPYTLPSLKELLTKLAPYQDYFASKHLTIKQFLELTKEALKKDALSLRKGNFSDHSIASGIIINQEFKILEVYKYSSAERAGIQVGDVITEVLEKTTGTWHSVQNMTLKQLTSMLSGQFEEDISLRILRKDKVEEVTLPLDFQCCYKQRQNVNFASYRYALPMREVSARSL